MDEITAALSVSFNLSAEKCVPLLPLLRASVPC